MYAAVRVRGSVNISPQIRKTLHLLGLNRVNHLVLVGSTQLGMLEKATSYITFGEIDEKTLALLLQKRGRTQGNKRIGDEFLRERKFKGFGEVAKALVEGKASLKGIGIKPVFRLRPPRKGFERRGIKRAYSVGGALGYRASDINKLLLRMI